MASIMSCSKKAFDDINVVIVGAGISGLSAAYQLKKYGIKNVIILEARSRIGGRIETANYGNATVEMGAQWIHGQNGNVIFELAKLHSLAETSSYSEDLFTWSNVTLPEERKTIIKTIEYLEEKITELQKKMPGHKESLLNYLNACFNEYLRIDKEHQSLKYGAFQWYQKYQCELNGCSSLDSVSARLLHRYHECEGDPLVELKYGYLPILDILESNLPSDCILKNKEVSEIVLNMDEKETHQAVKNLSKAVKVICNDGHVYEGDHVIVTLPLGCLKSTASQMFKPPLPQQKMNAITYLGFGTLNKVYLRYEEPFWESNFLLNIIWDYDAKFDDSLFVNEEAKELQPWYKYIGRFASVIHQPNLLCAWVVGNGAILMEKLPMTQVVSECHAVLEKKLMKKLPKPNDCFRSEWTTDKFSRGSYSYLSVDCDEHKVINSDLARPISISTECDQHPVILFAGEATHSHYYSTVHGAYETGIREADRLHYHYRKNELTQPPDSLATQGDIVVVGAGVSGLACAQRLFSTGLNKIYVLEAHDRLGGRINTFKHGSSVLELGAQWIHGEEGNPLYEYCKEHDLLSDPRKSIPNEAKGLFCTSNGEIVPEEVVDEVMLQMQIIKENMYRHEYNDTGASVYEVFVNGFEEYISSSNDTFTVKAWKVGVFEWFVRFEIIDNACENLRDITTLGYTSWIECPGHFYNVMENGFSNVLNSLVEEIPSSNITTSKPVKCIHWMNTNSKSSNFPVLVECCDGDWFAAKHVVVTPSVGFMKKNMMTFFKPSLPDSKQKAYRTTGFGTINKIFLVFPHRFWKKEEIGFQLIWLEESAVKEKFSLPETSWIFGISGFDQVRNQPNVLVAWVGGSYAKQVETISDEIAGKACANLLRQFLPKHNIPDPIQVIRSSWFSDPYIRGSYSSRTKEFYDTGSTVQELKEPLFIPHELHNGETVQWPAVIFAGEAMDQEYFATVHGALRSGWLEANRITSFTRSLRQSPDERFILENS